MGLEMYYDMVFPFVDLKPYQIRGIVHNNEDVSQSSSLFVDFEKSIYQYTKYGLKIIMDYSNQTVPSDDVDYRKHIPITYRTSLLSDWIDSPVHLFGDIYLGESGSYYWKDPNGGLVILINYCEWTILKNDGR